MRSLARFFLRTVATAAVLLAFARPRLIQRPGFLRLMAWVFLRVAPWYDAAVKRVSMDLYVAPLDAALHSTPVPPRRAVDLSAGTGIATERIAAAFSGATVIGTDLALPMLREAAQKSATGTKTLRFVGANSLALPFRDGSFDLAVTQNAPAYIEEMARVTRTGGSVCLAYSFPFPSVIGSLVRARLERAGLADVRILRAGAGFAAVARKTCAERKVLGAEG